MAQQILNDGDSGLDYRTKENDNFTELYQTARTMSLSNRAVTQSFSLTTTPQVISLTDTDLFTDPSMTFDPILGIWSITYQGIYELSIAINSNWGNGDDIVFGALVNGVSTGAGVTLTGKGANTNIFLGVPTFANLGANDTLEFVAYTLGGNSTLNIESGKVSLGLKVFTG